MSYHHRKLPDYSTLLSGHTPPNEVGFKSGKLQIWYNNSQTNWSDPAPHKHMERDECFVVLKGSLLVKMEDEQFMVGPREFVCFPAGVYHSVLEAYPPCETLMISAPAVEDKVYLNESDSKE